MQFVAKQLQFCDRVRENQNLKEHSKVSRPSRYQENRYSRNGKKMLAAPMEHHTEDDSDHFQFAEVSK